MKILEREVAKLVPHPMSAEIFGDMEDDDLEDLKDDLKKRGLQHFPEIDMEGRVICGSQRVKALRELGWVSVKVVLRDDLPDENAVREHLIKDNMLRRHLNPRQLYTAACELERIYSEQANLNMRNGKVGLDGKRVNARNKAAEDMGISGTTFHRMKRVFMAGDTDIIDAVQAGRLSIAAAERKVTERHGGSARSRAPGGAQKESLRFQTFKAEVDRFVGFLSRHPAREIPHYQADAASLLAKATEAVKAWQ
ncbi:MAG: ParB/RepB/Spo0J family partition protein [Bacteroidetes bacterium]|nr:ParB/RepB/Spo0J family partition protein [Bacteroidota bacterium]